MFVFLFFVGYFLIIIFLLSYFHVSSKNNGLWLRSRRTVLHDWYNTGRGMCYPVCGMMHIKEPLLLIGKSSICGGRGVPFLLSK